MIVGLNVDTSVAEHNECFATKPLTKKRTQVVYNETLKKVVSQGLAVDGLIIPSALPNSDYSFKKMIEHIRIDADSAISKIPILVYSADEEEYLNLFDDSKDFQESWFNKIAVAFSPDPALDDFISEVDKEALKAYVDQVGNVPYKKGSHDKSNIWGAYIVLFALKSIEKGNTHYVSSTEELQKRLIEETYYKRLLQKINISSIKDTYKSRLKSEISILKDTLKSGKVLIVEDQLIDGWQSAYEAIFSGIKTVELLFAEDGKTARKIVKESNEIDLVLLDVRLTSDREERLQDETSQPVEELTGVKLSDEIRGILPNVPIIAATASNKSWTLEALLERGISSYWVKASPDLIDTIDLGIENVIDLYKKINETLQWSQRTRFWQEELYRIAQKVQKYSENSDKNSRLYGKAKSLHALLFRSFSPFSKDLSKGLQMNIAFLTIYSCMNDLIEWVCDIETNGDAIRWYLQGDSKNTPVVERRKVHNEKYEWFVQDHCDNSGSKDFPDTAVAKRVLINKRLDFNEYMEMSKIRNGLPLIHGKKHESGSTSESVEFVTDEQITRIICLLSSLVDNHAVYLERQGNL